MATRPKKLCAVPGCPRLTRFSRCRRHQAAARQTDNRRPGRTHEKKFYKGRTWRTLRAATLADEPLCRLCRLAGRTVPAVEVDHIIPRDEAPELELAPANLQPLCSRCHSRKTGQARAAAAQQGRAPSIPGT